MVCPLNFVLTWRQQTRHPASRCYWAALFRFSTVTWVFGEAPPLHNMSPEARKRLLLGAGILFACACAATLAGVLTAVAIGRQPHGVEPAQEHVAEQQATEVPIAAAPGGSSGMRGSTSGGSGGSTSPQLAPSAAAAQQPAEEDAKAAYYRENQRMQESVFMALGPEALLVAAQDGELSLPYAGEGPCSKVRQVGNISLDLSAAATGCRGLQCGITLRVTLPEKGSCPQLPAPYPTILLISGESRFYPLPVCWELVRSQKDAALGRWSPQPLPLSPPPPLPPPAGFSCLPSFYAGFASRMASWGYAVMQYDRPVGGNLVPPPSEVETAYLDQIIAYRNAANRTGPGVWQGIFGGQFAAGPVGIIGHSMGGGEGSTPSLILTRPALPAHPPTHPPTHPPRFSHSCRSGRHSRGSEGIRGGSPGPAGPCRLTPVPQNGPFLSRKVSDWRG